MEALVIHAPGELRVEEIEGCEIPRVPRRPASEWGPPPVELETPR